jgi:hypothetical protein
LLVRKAGPASHTHSVRPKLIPPSTAAERRVEWRARYLRQAGFEPWLAHRLARNPTFDLHALLELIDRGCPPELAVRIAAPLDRVERRP